MNDTFNPSAAIITLDGKPHMKDARGALVPLETVKPMDKLQDEVVRKVVGFARALSQQISRFKGHTFEDIGALLALMEQQYGAKPGGKKGNMTFTSFDGCMKLQVAVADNIIFGAELQIAKSLIDECLKEWGADSRPELRAIITRAFQVDKEGRVNRAELFMLMRVEIEDPRWKQAMEAIRDSMRVIGSKTYYRFYERSSPTAEWLLIPLDIATAREAAATATAAGRDGEAAAAGTPSCEGIMALMAHMPDGDRAELIAGVLAAHALQFTGSAFLGWDRMMNITSKAHETVLRAVGSREA